MPKSKHRRKGKPRPRPSQISPPPKNPPPSPEWVPVVGTSLLVLGLVVILVGYLATPVQRLMADWPILGANWSLGIGFLLMIAGFGFLTKWR